MNAEIVKVGVTNCYLLKADEGYVLVDTAYARDWDAFDKGLEKSGIGLADIRYLVLTHHHDDHAGLLNQLVAKNPAIRIVMSENAKPLLAGGKNDWSRGGGYINRRVSGFVGLLRLVGRFTQRFPPYAVRQEDILVTEDTEMRALGVELDGRIVNTPGHSIDSISVALPNGDWLVGDAAANMPGFLGTKYCVILVEDLDQYYQTWTMMLGAGAKRVLPSHGRPFPAENLQTHLGSNGKSDMVPF